MAKKLGEIFVDIIGRLGPLKSAMTKAHDIVKRGMHSLTKWAKRGAIALGIGLAAGIAFAIKSAAAFETQMAKVATMLDEQTMHFIPKFGRAVKDLAIKFGEGTASITEGLYSILSASIAAGKAIKFLKTAMMAAKGGFTDTGTAAYVLTGVMNAYGYAADQVRKVSDILFTIQRKGQTSFAQFAPVLGRVTSIAAAMGIKLEEVAAALATLTRSGISTAESITYLRGLIVSLAGRSEKGIETAKKFGIELSASALRAKGLTGMLEDLSKVSDDALKDIVSETEARTGLSILIKNMSGYLEDLDDVMHSAGETQKAQAKVSATLTEKFNSLWQSIKTLATDIGERFMPMIKDAVDSLIKKFSNMRDELAAIWEGSGKNWSKFLSVLSKIASAKMIELAEKMAVYGKYAADKYIGGWYQRWKKRHLPEWEAKEGFKPFFFYDKRAEEERIARIKKGVGESISLIEKESNEKIKAIFKAANIEEGREEYLAMIAAERAETAKEEAEDEAEAAEKEAKRIKAAKEDIAALAKKLAAERKKAIEDAAEAEREAYIEKLEMLKDIYASMKGYEKEEARIQKLLWKERAKEIAKVTGLTEAAAYIGLAAKKVEAPMREAADRAKVGLVGFEQAWAQIATGAKRIEEELLREEKRQTPLLKEIRDGIKNIELESGVFGA